MSPPALVWSVLALMAAMCACLVALPLLRRWAPGDSAASRALAVDKDQLAALDREIAGGQLSSDDAAPLQAEILRRVLATADAAAAPAPSVLHGPRPWLAAGLLAVLLGMSGGLYAVLGNPQGKPTRMGEPEAPPPASPTPDLASMAAQLEARLRQTPDDAKGWHMLGLARLAQDQPEAAVAALGTSVRLAPDAPGVRAAYGEALVTVARGQVTPLAVRQFRAALARDLADPRAGYFLGLAKLQAGNPRAALADWVQLVNNAPADAPWASDMYQQAVALAARLKVDLTGKIKAPAAVDTSAMIAAMVAKLDARLKQQPGDADGWIKLMRARMVLGQPALATRALADGTAAFAADGTTQARLAAAAKALGVPQP